MTGFDRPLKPAWIYAFIQTVEIGDRLSDHKNEFNAILWELDGLEGKRKVRTVLSRYFLKSERNPRSKVVEYTPIIALCKRYRLDEIKPLLLYHLLMRSHVLRILTKMIDEIYGRNNNINHSFLRKKVIERFGERDISGRSLRNWLATLMYFGVLKKVAPNKYVWGKRLYIGEKNACYMLKLYSEEFKKSPQINLDELEDYLFLYFKMPDINRIGRRYNTILWEYSVRFGTKQILFHDCYRWDSETLDKAFEGGNGADRRRIGKRDD